MLLAAGGTLNPQLVAINAEGAKQFKSHFKNTASGVIAKEDRDRDAEEEVDDDEEGAEYQDGRNDDQDDNDDGRVHSRKRRYLRNISHQFYLLLSFWLCVPIVILFLTTSLPLHKCNISIPKRCSQCPF